MAAAAALFLSAIVFLAGAAVLVGLSGIGSDQLRARAEAAIASMSGGELDARLGPASISLDPSRLVALKVSDVRLARRGDEEPLLEAASLRFGVRLAPLLAGQLRIGSASIGDARIVPGARAGGGPDWTAVVMDERGLVDPDRVLAATFEGIRSAFGLLDSHTTETIALENVEIAIPAAGRLSPLLVRRATMKANGPNRLEIIASLRIGTHDVELFAHADRANTGGLISNLTVEARVVAEEDAESERLAAAKLVLEGGETGGAAPDYLRAMLTLDRFRADFGDDDTITGDVSLLAELMEGSDKIEIERLQYESGRSRLTFNGAVGPAPDLGPAQRPHYRFELVSDGSTLAPERSPEPALEFLARIAGRIDPGERRITADEIGVRTQRGEVLGTASARFGERGSPALTLALSVPRMPVGQAKQLWPWFSARGAREWVLGNVFGGEITDSFLRLQVEEDRFGHRIPLEPHEIVGTFKVTGARFDVAGRIPPVRHAVGVVDLSGTNVDIALSSATVFLGSGRTLGARDGTFRIAAVARDAPVIGALDIAVSGDAAAVAEFASHEPINAMRHVDLSAGDLSGAVSGRVVAQIPLQRNVQIDSLAWRVALDYEGLSIARPFEGRQVRDATGSIMIDPTRAVIKAEAMLDGMPATLSIVEPLGGSSAARERDIALELDDAARDRLLPGLSALLSGPVRVTVDADERDNQEVTADLTRATLSLPWAGWRKGAGVPARVEFSMSTAGRRTTLSRFRLTGDSFAVRGTVTLDGGVLASARLDEVRLNREDSSAFDVQRSGAGYTVKATGSSFDARALIKAMLSDPEKAAQTVEGTPVTVSARLDSLTGFSGETLRNVEIGYRGTGSRVGDLSITATTRAGGAVTVTNSSEGGARRVTMRSTDAGAILRFLDIYKNMEGGRIELALASTGNGPLRGQIDARDFNIVNEPRLRSLVASAPPGGDRSLNEAVRGEFDTSRAVFERGFTFVEKGTGYLAIDRGVLRGPQIGATFQGTLYDPRENMAITGTFMPAYGLNRLFGEIPLLGQILGNGRDRGLIGITFKLSGPASAPSLQINPLSVIAPGIFRSIFEFN